MSRRRKDECFCLPRGSKDECFGLPHGSSVFWLIIGVIIILWGITELFNIAIDLWPFLIVIFGILMVAGAIYGLSRKGR